MPNADLQIAYDNARRRHEAAVRELVTLTQQMAMETLADVLPGAVAIEAVGEFNEDWVPTLRIRRVLDSRGEPLFDVAEGHPDEAVESAVDEVNVEYLDVLIGLTGDELMGRVTIT